MHAGAPASVGVSRKLAYARSVLVALTQHGNLNPRQDALRHLAQRFFELDERSRIEAAEAHAVGKPGPDFAGFKPPLIGT